LGLDGCSLKRLAVHHAILFYSWNRAMFLQKAFVWMKNKVFSAYTGPSNKSDYVQLEP
jgi:hypothetical protein